MPSVPKVKMRMATISGFWQGRKACGRVVSDGIHLPSGDDFETLKPLGSRGRGVAQPGRAPALGAGGRRFKSYRPDHKIETDRGS